MVMVVEEVGLGSVVHLTFVVAGSNGCMAVAKQAFIAGCSRFVVVETSLEMVGNGVFL
jgi:hypothetical protein